MNVIEKARLHTIASEAVSRALEECFQRMPTKAPSEATPPQFEPWSPEFFDALWQETKAADPHNASDWIMSLLEAAIRAGDVRPLMSVTEVAENDKEIASETGITLSDGERIEPKRVPVSTCSFKVNGVDYVIDMDFSFD